MTALTVDVGAIGGGGTATSVVGGAGTAVVGGGATAVVGTGATVVGISVRTAVVGAAVTGAWTRAWASGAGASLALARLPMPASPTSPVAATGMSTLRGRRAMRLRICRNRLEGGGTGGCGCTCGVLSMCAPESAPPQRDGRRQRT